MLDPVCAPPVRRREPEGSNLGLDQPRVVRGFQRKREHQRSAEALVESPAASRFKQSPQVEPTHRMTQQHVAEENAKAPPPRWPLLEPEHHTRW